ncbi:hypothetical protein [Glycomyces arizonensis]|uniref:hypothetical protein n=1 Tax=Glycomyces arizonensis TaxID=256035 RepID=UPI00040DD4CF|nr:hypothetical protein [Glycomyces arizonensis]
MARNDPLDETTMAEYLAMTRAEGVTDERALEMAEGMSSRELRFVMEAQRLASSAPGPDDLQRLVQVRSDPRLLAAALPRARTPAGLDVGRALLLLFCVGCLAAALVMSLVLAGPLVGAVVDVGAVAVYLAVRPLVKRLGVLTAGSFTIDAAGVVRTIAGVGWARRRARRDGNEPSQASNFGVAVVFLLLVLFLPVTVAVLADLPEIMLGWMVMAMLALNEMTLLLLRTRRDAIDRAAEALDPEFGLALAADYLQRGGDPRRLAEGIGIRDLAPPDEERFASVMGDAFLRRNIALLTRED